MRTRGYHDCVGKSGGLDTCGDIGRVAKNVGLAADTCTNHHRTRVDADPRRQFLTPIMLVEFRDGIDNRQASSQSTLSIVIVCLRPPEIGHHSIAEVLSDITAKLG